MTIFNNFSNIVKCKQKFVFLRRRLVSGNFFLHRSVRMSIYKKCGNPTSKYNQLI